MSDNELTPTPHDVQFTITTPDGQPGQGLIAAPGTRVTPSSQA